jgi:hypothetical protein
VVVHIAAATGAASAVRVAVALGARPQHEAADDCRRDDGEDDGGVVVVPHHLQHREGDDQPDDREDRGEDGRPELLHGLYLLVRPFPG